MGKEPDLSTVFARNLARLMAHNNLSQVELSKRTGVAQSTLSAILSRGNASQTGEPSSAGNPRAKTIQAIAAYLRVPAYLLMIPDIPLDLMLSPRLQALLDNYREAPEQGRRNVERIAESEKRYAMTITQDPDKRKTG